MSEAQQKAEEASDIEIEIVDDTPEEDRGRPLAPEYTDTDDDILVKDDEISRYKDDIQKRIKDLSFKTHAERRTKDLAVRQRDEALRYAEIVAEENKRLRELAGNTEKFAVDQAKNRAESEINATKRLMKEAFEAGETDRFIEQQEKLQRLVNEHERYSTYTPPVYQAPVAEPPKIERGPDQKAVAWASRNTWFDGTSEIEKEMTGYAYAVSDMLIRDHKIDPQSDKYYSEIDKRVQSRFAEYFKKPEPEIDVTAKAPTVVAPATRTSKTVSKVRLTQTQVALARRFGLTPEQYVAQYLKDYGHE